MVLKMPFSNISIDRIRFRIGNALVGNGIQYHRWEKVRISSGICYVEQFLRRNFTENDSNKVCFSVKQWHIQWNATFNKFGIYQ